MPQSATVKLDVKIKSGPELKSEDELTLASYTPVQIELEPNQNELEWVDVYGGAFEKVRFLAIKADRYKTEDCKQYGLVFSFGEDESHLPLNGPQFFSGYALDLIQSLGIKRLGFKNPFQDAVTIDVLVGIAKETNKKVVLKTPEGVV